MYRTHCLPYLSYNIVSMLNSDHTKKKTPRRLIFYYYLFIIPSRKKCIIFQFIFVNYFYALALAYDARQIITFDNDTQSHHFNKMSFLL